MRYFDRSIKIAFDKTTGEILDADEVFDIAKDAFQIRKKYHEKNIELSCCECEQDLMVSGSKYDRLHFKHKPGHSYCILADGKLTPHDHEKFTAILKAKESDRHKELKNKIGKLLKSISGVDVNSIQIDNKFIVKDNEKRRPDVYCKFQEKELVFEIQLSDLSLGYILSRYDFYKKHGMYLIWILDNFDIHNQGTLERDIKYLTKYENFFKLDENVETLKLLCDYKFPYLTDNNKFLTKWLKKSVELNELKFDSEVFQVFYYNFGDNKTKTETLQKQKEEELKEVERKKREQEKLENAERTIMNLVAKIADFRKRKIQNFDSISNELEELDDFELSVLNKTLNLKGKNISPLIKWIDESTQDDAVFLNFILKTNKIELEINTIDNGRTPLQALFENENIYKTTPALSLFQAGYRLTESDNLKLSELKEKQKISEADFYIFKFCNNLTDRNLVSDVVTFQKQLFIIESARKEKLVWFSYTTGNIWVSFANNAIQSYSEYWEYIELAFKRYGLWDKLIQLDTKGTFQKKVEQFYSNIPRQKYDFDEVFNDLYPELEYAL
jgi:competence CoiA-like predicted nuclease